LSGLSGNHGEMEDKRIVSGESYRIETTIAKNDHFNASTELHLRALRAGDRVIPWPLFQRYGSAASSAAGRRFHSSRRTRRRMRHSMWSFPKPWRKARSTI